MNFDFLTNLSPQTIQVLIVLLVAFALYHLLTIKKNSPLSEFWKKFGPNKNSLGSGTPTLNSFTVDFTALAKNKRIDPVVGRHDEVLRLAQVLSRRSKNNAILVGPPGVGKTAIVEALAERIVSGEVPDTLRGKRVLSLDVATLLSGTKYRGEFEERAKRLVQEISLSNRTIILFIDEVHSVIQSQGTEGAVNFSDILKPALARGDLQMIGATTIAEYEKYIRTDAALERRFQVVVVAEPTEAETVEILKGIKDKYREYHKVEFTDAALVAAVQLTSEFIPSRTQPDKAIDAIDEAASMVRVSHVHDALPSLLYEAAVQKNPGVKEQWQKILSLDKQIGEKTTPELQTEREKLESELQKQGIVVVDVGDIEAVIQNWREAKY